jgi:hypothetical protein
VAGTVSDLGNLVADTIADGRWRTIDFLAHTLSVPRRSIEEAIQHLRLTGHPVIGGDSGVRMSDSASEVRAYAQDRRRRLVSIAQGTRALLNTARRMESPGPQQRLPWDIAA